MQATGRPRTVLEGDDTSRPRGTETWSDTDEVGLAGVEQAEAEAAAAEEIAAAARKRLDMLRQLGASDDMPESVPTPNVDDDNDHVDTSLAGLGWPLRRLRRWRRPSPATIITTVALALTCALLVVSGYLIAQHRQVEQERQRQAEFAAAAGQAVVTLMSINSDTAQDEVQRIIDNSTGQFRADFQQSAKEFVEVAKESQAITTATVKATAVESSTDNSAVVLVTAATTITNSEGADQQPRTWRLSVDVIEDNGQIKMSKVDFVP